MDYDITNIKNINPICIYDNKEINNKLHVNKRHNGKLHDNKLNNKSLNGKSHDNKLNNKSFNEKFKNIFNILKMFRLF
jgi:hypothetical protein